MAVMRMESAGSTACSSYAAGWWMPRLAGPLITAVVVRLMLLAVTLARNGIRPLINPDTTSYLEPGRNLLLHGRFVADGVPDLLRTPGYPLFLAATSLAGLPAAALANVILRSSLCFSFGNWAAQSSTTAASRSAQHGSALLNRLRL